jgi:ADP-heptose:LPS heptosyltransferase
MKNIFSGVILEGSRGEKKYTEAVAEKLELPFVDLAGKTNLLQAAAILQRAGLFVGADSGLGHIAAAMGTPTLTFFSVDRPERVLPWGGNPYWLASPDENTGNIPLESTIEKVKDIYGA